MTTKVTSGLISADAALVDLNIDANTLYVDASANKVGLGTSSPNERLQIAGNLTLTPSSPNNSPSSGATISDINFVGRTDNAIVAKVRGIHNDNNNGTDGQLIFYTADNTASAVASEKMRIDSLGNVGIGTGSPGEKFAVNGDGSYIEITHPTASSYSGMKFSEGGVPQGSLQNIGSTFSTVARRGNFEIFHNTGGDLTLQFNGGNVGIGTSEPRQKFSVTGPLVSTGALVTLGSAGSYTDGDFDATALDYYDSGARNWCWGSGSARGTFVWNQLYNDGTNQITSMKLDTGGNVVLGGIAAAAREPLHVHRPSTSDAQIHLTNSATGNTSGDGLTMFVNSTTAGFWMREAGNLRFATNNTERGEFDANGMFLPAADDTYDIGSSAKRWRNMYTADLHLSNEGKQNDVDGTSGNWTIQEGENDLFLINNKNGKKFKFSLEEVE